MASSSSSSLLPLAPPSSSSPSWNHDVFPSFHGPDVRRTFLSHILNEFRRKGINTFNDNEIARYEQIGPELVRAIRESRIAIVILSRNYASSSWRLHELVEITKCREELGQVVVSIFYNVDPSDVKKQTGDFGKHFRKTCKGRTKEDIENWKQALASVATIAGYHSPNWDNDRAMIEKIASDISDILNNFTQSNDFEDLVGMKANMEKMESMLCLDSYDEVKMIGILGPPGIGKTTISRCLFSRYSNQFQFSVFMDNIKGRYPKPCFDEYSAKLQLQKELLSQMFNHEGLRINHLGVLQDRLKDKSVLVVLDGVDCLAQIEAMAKETRWFGPGSRIIITTQERRLLRQCGINHIYEVGFPQPDEALQIFCMYAFGQKSPLDGFENLAWEVTELAGGFPLGLRVMGSYLRGMSKQEWTNKLPRLRTSVDGEIESITKFMYNSLCDDDKDLYHHYGDLNESKEEYLGKDFSEVRQEPIITNHDLKEDSLCDDDDKKISPHHISYLPDGELTERIKEYLAKGFSEVRQERIITNQDLKEDLYTSERAFEDTVYIYCEDRLQNSFASHLSMDFCRKCIDAFVNCNETLDVIERVSASVIIFSESCFSSTSFLDKLVRVLQCRRKTGQLVIPVFYGISPSDVVVQEQESADWITEWSSALHELRELPGHHSRKECSEQDLVEEIVKDVYEKLFPVQQIGISSRLLEIEQLLCKQPWGIRRIGIWGMPGIGKTTLAKAVFDQISGGYKASCFIKHFEKVFHEKGFHGLLEDHFGKFLKELPGVCSSITRPSLPKDKLSKMRTLVVLDDVHNPLLAESILGGFHWFGPGSLIIITSRDKQVFRHCQITHVYEVQSLNENDAMQLFSQLAFGKNIREQNLLELSMEVIDYANGNPLALRFYARELKGKNLSEMETTFLNLKLRTPHEIQNLFKISYEKLDDNEKNIFLDIACFFKGENVGYVMQLLEGCGFFPHVGIDVLVENCLVTISENRVKMHSIIQDFGREIINGETRQIERRRRLWESSSIKFLLEDEEFNANGDPQAAYTRALGTEDIEGIFMDTSNLMFDVKPGAFDNMFNLRFLKIYCSSDEKHHGLRLPKGLKSLPCELRLLHWENYPLQSLPQDFDPCHLVEINMPHSRLKKLWRGTKDLGMLKIVRLCHSQQLIGIDNICKAQNVEQIDLQGCTKLQSFPAMCQSQHLRVVNLSGCRGIISFPEVSPNIKELHLQGTGIRELPISIVTLSQQAKLNQELSNLLTKFSGVSDTLNVERLTSLVKVISSNQHLGKLVRLNMKDCSHLQSLPDMIDLESLKVLHLSGCSQLKDIQGFPRNLKELYLACTAIKELPELPQSLEVLNAHGCESLEAIPFGFNQLPRYYTFSDCFALSAQVVIKFLAKALADVAGIAKENEQERELKESLTFSLCVPSIANKKLALGLEQGSSVMIPLDPSSRSTLMGFIIFFEVAFSEDYHEAIGFDVRCVRRWKDMKGVSRKLEKTFHCWTPEEGLGKFEKDHLFVFCDLNLHPFSGEGKDPDVFADFVVFEVFPVNKQEKLIDKSCKVTKCGVSLTRGRSARS